ncbi:outer membrane protein assembly factor BamB family protein [Embleya sp. NPDC055664]
MYLSGRRKTTRLFIALSLLTALLVGPFPTQRAHADDGLTDILDHKYGLFVHYVPARTVTPGGVVVHDSNALANAFDANGFADDLAATKVQYVVFTAWHAGMVALYPSRTMLDWDLPDHRVERDLIGDMITAVKAKGIRVYLYTHPRDGMEFTAADRQKTGWGTQPHPPGQRWNPGADFDRPRWNTFVDDVYRELMQRYGARIDALFMDEASPAGDSRTVLDYPRLRTTIKAVNPRAVLIQNDYGNLYGLDKGMKEYFGQNEFAQPDGDLWPGYAKPVTAALRATETSWWASETGGSVKYPPRSMFRYRVLQAGTNTDGGGTAAVAGAVVYVGVADGTVYAFDAATGTKTWTYATGSTVTSSPTVADSVVYVGTTDGTVHVVDSTDGTKKWVYPTGSTATSPVVTDAKVYVGTIDGTVYALDVVTAAKRWTYPTGSASSSFAIAHGMLYVGAHDGTLYALDAVTGAGP